MRIITVTAIVLLGACTASPDVPETAADPAHSSHNALDWPGTYNGVVPCADCEGIRTTVTLLADGTFERERMYRGKSTTPVRDSGRFTWNDAGSVVTLAAPDGATQMYQVGENQLFLLDQAGNRIGGELAGQYVLRQSLRDPRIEGGRWLLVEVMGQPYALSDATRSAFILFDSDDSSISGNNSCNNFFGTYAIESGQRLRFGEIMGATRMACPDMTTEQAFMDALDKVDNYAVDGDHLSLNRARMAPLLRFELAPGTD